MQNKILWVVVALLIVIGGYYLVKSDTVSAPSGATASPTASVSPVAATSTAKPKATASPVAKTYTQLVAEYAGRMIQFDSSCQASPSSFVLKNGDSILLDNRANVARTIKVGDMSYSLGVYGYQVVTISNPSVPHTVNVNCGSSVNVSQVFLQANISGQ